VIETSSRERAEALDAMLWTYRDDSFLPHGIAGDASDPDQPVLIATDDGNANAAQVRFFVDRSVPHSGWSSGCRSGPASSLAWASFRDWRTLPRC